MKIVKTKKTNPHRLQSMRVQGGLGMAGKSEKVSHEIAFFVKKYLATIALMMHVECIAALGWPSWGWAHRLTDRLLVIAEGGTT